MTQLVLRHENLSFGLDSLPDECFIDMNLENTSIETPSPVVDVAPEVVLIAEALEAASNARDEAKKAYDAQDANFERHHEQLNERATRIIAIGEELAELEVVMTTGRLEIEEVEANISTHQQRVTFLDAEIDTITMLKERKDARIAKEQAIFNGTDASADHDSRMYAHEALYEDSRREEDDPEHLKGSLLTQLGQLERDLLMLRHEKAIEETELIPNLEESLTELRRTSSTHYIRALSLRSELKKLNKECEALLKLVAVNRAVFVGFANLTKIESDNPNLEFSKGQA